MADEQVTFRLDTSTKEAILKSIAAGRYENIAHFCRQALREKLERESGDERESQKQQIIEAIKNDPDIKTVLHDLIREMGNR